MAKVFISYSRKDIEFAKRLTGELQKSDLDFWIDWEGIPPTVDWWKEIEKGIEEADAFLFLISPDSAKSTVCAREIDVAAKNGKQFVPLVVRDVKADEAPHQLKKFNWIFFRKSDDFNTALHKLLVSIHTDFEWLQAHRQLQVKALEWERNNHENSLLLHGKELQDVESQLLKNASKEPHPTAIQNKYVFESRRTADIQFRSSQIRRITISGVGIMLLIIIILAQMGMFNRFVYRPVDMVDYWVTIPGGEFLMGSSDEQIAIAEQLCSYCDFSNEQHQHWVDLPEYQIGRYEVTNKQYNQCLRVRVCIGRIVPDNLDHPVVNVNWRAAKTYCEWVGGRLPTEAEWEKAASWDDGAKTKRTYPWGESIDCTRANYYDKDGGGARCVGDTKPVNSYESGKSPYGLYNMAGNVWEWVNDRYSDTYYQSSPSSNPLGPESGDSRVLRGGSLIHDSYYVRSASRGWGSSSDADGIIGFRCARSLL